MARMIAHAKAPSGMTISGPMLLSPHGAGAVCGYGELYFRSTAQRAGGVHGSIVRPDRLPRDRQPQAGSTRLMSYVRFPDLLQILGRDAFAVVRDRDPHRIATTEFCRTR